MDNFKVKCSTFEIANNRPFTLIAGPCQLESEEHALQISSKLKSLLAIFIPKALVENLD